MEPNTPEEEHRRQLRQGDLPVQPDRPLEPPADGVSIFPTHMDIDTTPLLGELEQEPEPDPVRDAVLSEDWPDLPVAPP